ncbi:MAG: hypothetical protein ACLFO3_06560, partial [Candidatus Acetothermia bacterium]
MNIFSGLSFKKVLFIGAIGVIVAGILWLALGGLGGENKATRDLLGLPDGQVKIENEDGQEINLDVKVGSFNTSLSDVNPEVLQETVLYIASPSPRSFVRVYEDIETDVEVAYFSPTGKILEIFTVAANTTERLAPEEEYQYS